MMQRIKNFIRSKIVQSALSLSICEKQSIREALSEYGGQMEENCGIGYGEEYLVLVDLFR